MPTQQLIEFLGDHDMSLSQFLLCWTLYLDHQEHSGKILPSKGKAIANVYRYAELVGGWLKDEINDLVDRGYLIDSNSGQKVYPDNLRVTKKFVGAIFTTRTDFERFLSTYPDVRRSRNGTICQSDKETALKAASMDKVEKLFNSNVRSKAEFCRVMTALKWAKKKGKLDMNIEKYVSGKVWNAHLKEMQGDPQVSSETLVN